MISASNINKVCEHVIELYHDQDDLECNLPVMGNDIKSMIHYKSMVDSIQWHLEDEVRNPSISAEQGWALKKRIDHYNDLRTNTVESMDHLLFEHFKDRARPNAYVNSETPGWIIDRLSILCLKIYHMKAETMRSDADDKHIKNCQSKLDTLKTQQIDLSYAFDHLMTDLATGNKKMKRYLQMKMYNDESLNPVLYKK